MTQRVAVRRRPCGFLRANDARGARLIVHDHLLAHGFVQLRAEKACEDVRRARGRMRNDDADGLCGICLCVDRPRSRQSNANKRQGNAQRQRRVHARGHGRDRRHFQASVSCAAAIQQGRLHLLHCRAVVLHEAAPEFHHAAVRFAALLLLEHGGLHVQRVAVLDRCEHAPLVDLQEREQRAVVDAACVLEPAHDCVDEGAVRDRFAELGRLRVFPVRVHFVEIAREAREVHDVR